MKYYPSLYEGVGDKFAEQEFNIPDETTINDETDLVGKITHTFFGKELTVPTKIYLNPKSLDNCGAFVRALVLENGDLYVADRNKDIIHVDILTLLIKKGILFGSLKPEDLQDMIDADLSTRRALGMTRVGKRDIFAISEESYLDLNNMPYLKAAEKKNPNFKFANKNVFKLDNMLKENKQ